MRLALVLVAFLTLGAIFSTDAVIAQNPPSLVRVLIDLPGRSQPGDNAAIVAAGGVVRHEFVTSNTIAIEVSPQALAGLEHNPRFRNIRPDPVVSAVDTVDWGVNQVDADVVWGGSQGATVLQNLSVPAGQGVKVAILDTGIDTDHPDLVTNIAGGRNWATTGQSIIELACSGGREPAPSNSNYQDENGHGTHVAARLRLAAASTTLST